MITCTLVAAVITCTNVPVQPDVEQAVRVWTSNTKPFELPPPPADPAMRNYVAPPYNPHWPFNGPITDMVPTRPLSPLGSLVTYYPYGAVLPYSPYFAPYGGTVISQGGGTVSDRPRHRRR